MNENAFFGGKADVEDLGQRHLTFGAGAGLVDDDFVDRAAVLQDFSALDDHAELGAAPGPDHDP